jgi:hypothetical protein
MKPATSSRGRITTRNSGLTGIRRSRFRLTRKEPSISARNSCSAHAIMARHGTAFRRI